MELQGGWRLVLQQYRALVYKNLLLSWRNRQATFIQLFSSFFFIFLIFCIQKAVQGSFFSSSSFKDLYDPDPLVAPPITACEDKFTIVLPCFDFVWSGNESERVTEIVRRIRENNPGRPIPEQKVKGFRTTSDTEDWLASNPMKCPGALHFFDRNATVISYGVQTNSTPLARQGRFEDPTFKFQIPLQLAAEREIARFLIGDPNFSWSVSFKEFAHPATNFFSAVQQAGPTFFLAAAMFSFVFQMSSLITEKELKLRQALTMMGLYDTAYWLSWFTWEGILTLISSLLLVLFGMMFRFDFFLRNSFAVLFLLFFLFQLNMSGLAFMLSAFSRKSSSSTTVGYCVFIIGFICQVVTAFGFPYSDNFSKPFQIAWSFFPPNLLTEGLKLLTGATETPQDPGVSWKDRNTCAPNDSQCMITVNEIYIWFASTFFLWLILALYFDNIIPNASGMRKSLLYFMSPGYWTGKNGSNEGSFCRSMNSNLLVEDMIPDDEDVLEEERVVKQQAAEGHVDPDIAVQIRGLAKIYDGATGCACFSCSVASSYHALRGLWLNISKDQLFCLLGPNGAGKTTAINCLTGIAEVTAGDAIIYGNSIRSSGMPKIRRMIGVCPQFDILWNELSGEEHLFLFASIKGIIPGLIKSAIDKLLADVKLTEAATMRSSSYSGGMRRRLSVAIALIGDPKLVFLDEPTTGMDPITRRHIWDLIDAAKKGRAIILTTHSMEEADILSDRIGIMAKGRLRCIGTSIHLKTKFGSGFVANINFTKGTNSGDNHHIAVKSFFKSRLDIIPSKESKSFLTFVIPREKERLLKDLFSDLQRRQKQFGIADIQLGLTTLEQVFLNIVKQTELENASSVTTMASLTLNSGFLIQIPLGARFVGIPGSETPENPRGVMVEVYWQQDDFGMLCISGHSVEMPIPSHIKLGSVSQPCCIKLFHRRKPIRGVVIHPSEVIEE